jgi:hypothetical protein
MAVERLSITSSRIITRDSSNNTTFDTERRYLKSDSSGQLLAGGFTRAPIVAGSSGTNLYDHVGAGGFIVNLSSEIPVPRNPDTGDVILTGHPYTLNFSAPAFDNLTVDMPQFYDRETLIQPANGDVISFQGNGRNIGTYRWSLYRYETSSGGEGGGTSYYYFFYINYIALSEAFEGGTLTFPWPGSTNYGYDIYGTYGKIVDFYWPNTIVAMFTPALYCTKTPNNLALAVTP